MMSSTELSLLPHVEVLEEAVCPRCNGHNVVRYMNFEAFHGCLDCGWTSKDEPA